MTDDDGIVVQFGRLVLEVSEDEGPLAPTNDDVGAIVQQYGLGRLISEEFWVICFDGVRRVRTIVRVAQGSYHDVAVSIPVIMAAVHTSGCDRFVVAHNHPNGAMFPTGPDIDITRQIATAAASNGLYFEDHIIVGPNDQVYSMVESGRLIPPPGITAKAAASRRTKAREPSEDEVVVAPQPVAMFVDDDGFRLREGG